MFAKFRFTVANMLKATGWFAVCCVALAGTVRALNRDDLIPAQKVELLIGTFIAVSVCFSLAVATLLGQPKVGLAIGYAIAFVAVPIVMVFIGVLALLFS
jgi:hypothetical protein